MKKTPLQNHTGVAEKNLEILLERASKSGAKLALKELGLQDQYAAQDIHDLRDLLRALQTAKKEIFRSFIRWITLGILTLVLLGILAKTGGIFE